VDFDSEFNSFNYSYNLFRCIFSTISFTNEKKDIVGLAYSVDLIGAVIGSLIAGFLLVPILGNSLSIVFVSALNVLVGIILIKNKNIDTSNFKISTLENTNILKNSSISKVIGDILFYNNAEFKKIVHNFH